MKARIIKEGAFWVGQVYGSWSGILGLYKREGWETMTGDCFTKTGAKIALLKWKREHVPDEFEI